MVRKPVLWLKWYVCPSCGQKLFTYDNTAKVKGIYLKCKKCKKTIEIDITQ